MQILRGEKGYKDGWVRKKNGGRKKERVVQLKEKKNERFLCYFRVILWLVDSKSGQVGYVAHVHSRLRSYVVRYLTT